MYTVRSVWWAVALRARRTLVGYDVTYLDYGKFRPLPARYVASELIAQLALLCKHPRKRRFDITINKQGLVSFDADRELVLLARS